MSSKTTFLILVLILLMSAYSITLFLKPGDIFSPAPIYTDDYAMHFSQCISTKRFLSSFGKCWGYDPFFLAGYPRGALVNADNKAWELLFFAFSPLSEGFAFKLYLILFLLLYPFFLYAAARNFNLSRGTGIIASVLSMLFFCLSIAIEFVSWGMVSFVFISYFSIYLFSLFYKLFEHFTWKRYVIVTLLSSLILMMHILSPLILFFPLLTLYFCNFKKLSLSRHLLMGLMVTIILVINSFWLIPVLQFFQDKTTRPENYNFTLQINSLSEPVTVYLQQKQSTLHRKTPQLNNTFIDVIILLFGVCGFYHWWRGKKTTLAFTFSGGVVVLFLIAYYGSHTDFFAQLQPQRFTIPLNILLIMPGSAGLGLILQTLFERKSGPAIFFISSLIFVVLVGPVAKPLKAIYGYNLYRLNCEFPPPLKELLNWLENHTSREGRILVEDSESDTYHQYYGAHFPALFPEYVKREYLCAPRPIYPIKHSYASFTAGVLFEKRVEDYTLEELQRYFDLYNVKWIVCWLEKSKIFFNQYPGYLVKKGEIDTFTIYEVNKNPSFFLKGEGVVKSDYNQLALSQLTAVEDEVVISYHWMQGLRSNPARKLERVFVGNDPIGFIRIINPPKSLVIYNGY